MVTGQYSAKTQKLPRELFQKCLASLCANEHYLDWLPGQNLSERSRAPAYNRIRTTFVERIFQETEKKPLFPKPEWAHG
jgi:hypothetical protein